MTWTGTVDTSSEQLKVEACVSDLCSARTVTVDLDGDCRSETQWQGEIGSFVCAATRDMEVRIAFSLDLTERAEDLADGDWSSLQVRDAQDDTLLLERRELLDYRGDSAGRPRCRTADVYFGSIERPEPSDAG